MNYIFRESLHKGRSYKRHTYNVFSSLNSSSEQLCDITTPKSKLQLPLHHMNRNTKCLITQMY
jgi:hypothetical protein